MTSSRYLNGNVSSKSWMVTLIFCRLLSVLLIFQCDHEASSHIDKCVSHQSALTGKWSRTHAALTGVLSVCLCAETLTSIHLQALVVYRWQVLSKSRVRVDAVYVQLQCVLQTQFFQSFLLCFSTVRLMRKSKWVALLVNTRETDGNTVFAKKPSTSSFSATSSL